MSLCLTLRVNLGLSLRKTSQTLKDIYNIQISHQQIANYCKTASLCVKPFVDNYDYSAGNTFTADETYIKVRGIKTYIWFIMDAARRSIIGYRVSDNRGVGSCIMAMRMAFRHFKELSKEFRPFKQMIERLNRTYKASYRKTNRFDNMPGKWQLLIFLGQQTILQLQKQTTAPCAAGGLSVRYICNFQGSSEPIFLRLFFHRSLDTTWIFLAIYLYDLLILRS